jgi:alpha-beta hydrolase superfamily lysophospholipase
MRGGLLLKRQCAVQTDHCPEKARRNSTGWLAAGYACLAIDARGTGELQGLDIRLMTYLGTAPAFAMAVDAVAAVEAMHKYSAKVAVVGSGLGGAQVSVFAVLMDLSVTWAPLARPTRSSFYLVPTDPAAYPPHQHKTQPPINK